jgi:multiple sugar transport system substrate-binding protein/putative aldouronate transport system substrate-binding protein
MIALLPVLLAVCSNRNAGSSTTGTQGTAVTIPTSTNFTPKPLEGFYQTKGIEKFPNPVVINVGMAIDPSDETLPDGDTVENSQYTRFLAEYCNIIIKTAWTAAVGNDFNQKLAMAIASNTLPDAVVSTTRNQFLRAYQGGMLYDITDVWQENVGDFLRNKAYLEGGKMLEQSTINGRLMAIPSASVTTDGVHLAIVRKDWLDKLGLPEPKTLQDIEKTARAFLNAGYGRIGIAGPDKSGKAYCTFLESSNNPYGFDPVFQAVGATPGYWLTDSAGKVSYGTLSAETKTGLGVLADWFSKGLLDPEIGVRDSASEVISSNATGIYFGPWWAMAYGNMSSLQNDPTADWQFYPVYNSAGKWVSHMKEIGNTYLMINKNVTPEVAKAIVVVQNVYGSGVVEFDNFVEASHWMPLRHIIANMTETEYEYDAYFDLLEGKTTKADYYNLQEPTSMTVYNNAEHFFDSLPGFVKGTPRGTVIPLSWFDQTAFYFQRTYAILIGDRVYSSMKPDVEVYSALYGMTDTMQRRWANLQSLENEMVIKIITGAEPLSYFDSFVTQWKAEGGDEITAEVQGLVVK